MKLEFVPGLENAGWPVLIVNGRLAIQQANSAARRLFELESAQDTPLSKIWSSQNPSSAEKFLDNWERAPMPLAQLKLRTKQAETATFAVCICVFFKEGDKNFLLQILPESGPKSEASTPAAQAKTEIGESAALQKQKLECALQLARTVALDFNNALTSILGHTSLVLSKLETTHPMRSSLIEVEKSAARAAEIANDLGMFSRQDKEPKGQAAKNLNSVLQRNLDAFRSNSDSAVQWNVLLERKLFTAKFDEAKMQQVFLKILENAIEALPSGSGRITVQTKNLELAEKAQDRNVQLPPGAYVLTEISDNGKGIEAEVLPRVFEPFFTTKGGKHKGLGLAWVYGIVTNHAGGVAVSSQVNLGTSVRVYLPAESQIVRDTSITEEDLRGSQTILIVDDEDMLLTMGETILSAYGYRVLTANSGQKALEVVAREPKLDLVITDLVMPSMSGRELVEQLAQKLPDVPILCTSGYVWQGTQDQDSAYLQKPFTSQDLLLKVKHLLNSGD